MEHWYSQDKHSLSPPSPASPQSVLPIEVRTFHRPKYLQHRWTQQLLSYWYHEKAELILRRGRVDEAATDLWQQSNQRSLGSGRGLHTIVLAWLVRHQKPFRWMHLFIANQYTRFRFRWIHYPNNWMAVGLWIDDISFHMTSVAFQGLHQSNHIVCYQWWYVSHVMIAIPVANLNPC